MPTDTTGDRALKNIIDTINSMANIKKEKANLEKSLLLDEITRQRDLNYKRKEATMWQGMYGGQQTNPTAITPSSPSPTTTPMTETGTIAPSMPATTPQGYGGTVTMPGVGQGPFMPNDMPSQTPTMPTQTQTSTPTSMTQTQPSKQMDELGFRPISIGELAMERKGKPEHKDYAYIGALKKLQQGIASDSELSMIREFNGYGKDYESPQIQNLPQLEPNSPLEEKKAFLDQLNNQDKALVQGLANYNLDISKVTSIRGGERQRLASLATRFDPTFSMNDYNARKLFLGNYKSGVLGQNRISINTAMRHIGTLAEKFNKLDNLQSPLINAVINPGKYIAGKKEIVGVKSSIAAVANELAKAFKGTGVTAESEIDNFKKLISENASPEQMREATQTFFQLLDGRIQEIDNQYLNTMGKYPENQDYSQKVQEVIQKLGLNNNQGVPQPDQNDLQSKIQQAKSAGYSDEEINKYLGSLNAK